MIECEGVIKYYDPKITVLSGASFTVNQGEFVFMAGESGSGKTTLFKLLYGEEKPTAGSLHVNGETLERLKCAEIPRIRKKLGLVFQDLKLFKDRTVEENIAFPLHVLGTAPGRIREEVNSVIQIFQLEGKGGMKIRELSSAEKRRTALARAIVHHPVCLLADEPFATLTQKEAVELYEFLDRVNVMGTTIFLLTRDQWLAENSGKKVLYLDQGTVKHKGN